MPLVFDRMYAYAESHGLQLQPQEKRKELGRLIAKAYHLEGNKPPLKTVPLTEEGIKYRVLLYPKDFRDQMDAIISQFFKDNPPPERVIKRIRKRIPVAPRKVLLPLKHKV